MSTAVVIALALVLVAYVAAPLRRGRSSISDPSDELDDAQADKRVKLEALIELEEDQLAGKLSSSDFDHLRRQYESEAVAALQRVDALTEDGDSDELEEEIQRAKARLRCPSCGAARQPGTRCPACGA